MKIIFAYDVKAERDNKVRKVVQKYLYMVQESLYEGDLSNKTLEKLKSELKPIIDVQYDSIKIYKFDGREFLTVDEIGAPSLSADRNIL